MKILQHNSWQINPNAFYYTRVTKIALSIGCQKAVFNSRNKTFSQYMEAYPEVFTNITQTWAEDNIFYAKNDKGTFAVRFVEEKIFKVTFTDVLGNVKVLYGK